MPTMFSLPQVFRWPSQCTFTYQRNHQRIMHFVDHLLLQLLFWYFRVESEGASIILCFFVNFLEFIIFMLHFFKKKSLLCLQTWYYSHTMDYKLRALDVTQVWSDICIYNLDLVSYHHCFIRKPRKMDEHSLTSAHVQTFWKRAKGVSVSFCSGWKLSLWLEFIWCFGKAVVHS